MKLNFTKKEKKDILKIISDYETINKEMESLKKQSEDIQKRVDECSKKLGEINIIEQEMLSSLRDKYGKFTLQDISDTIYGK